MKTNMFGSTKCNYWTFSIILLISTFKSDALKKLLDYQSLNLNDLPILLKRIKPWKNTNEVE